MTVTLFFFASASGSKTEGGDVEVVEVSEWLRVQSPAQLTPLPDGEAAGVMLTEDEDETKVEEKDVGVLLSNLLPSSP